MLSGFGATADYQPNDAGPWITRLNAELQAGSGSIGVLGALHGDFSAMDPENLVDLSAKWAVSAASGTFNSLAMLGTDSMQYIPWMQASYVMAANKEALQYLPDGADINALTYDQLIAWAANVHEATGEAEFGFPAGPDGLKHRFFQGYLYPSYTNGVVRTFASDEAVVAWESSAPCGSTPTRPRPTSRSCRNSCCRATLGSCSTTPRVLRRPSTTARTISWPSRRLLAPPAVASCRFWPG